jgi:HSP20 family protein
MNLISKKSVGVPTSSRSQSGGGDDLMSFQREMNNLVGSFFNRGDLINPQFESSFYPSVDIKEKENKYLLDADLPGMNDADVSVDFQNNVLTIKGEKKSEKESKDEDCVCIERSFGSFRRDIAFNDDIDKDNIKAELKNGVLHVELAKKEKSKESHRKIQIKH